MKNEKIYTLFIELFLALCLSLSLGTLILGGADAAANEQLAQLPKVTEVRGKGLMVAADLEESVDAPQVVLDALDAGLLLNATGPHTLRFLPPLICTCSNVDSLIARLKELL